MNHGGTGHVVTSPPPRAHNPFEVPIQIQPGYQPLKGLYSDVSIEEDGRKEGRKEVVKLVVVVCGITDVT